MFVFQMSDNIFFRIKFLIAVVTSITIFLYAIHLINYYIILYYVFKIQDDIYRHILYKINQNKINFYF